jgi:membrane-associated phospholipid phosphatase
MFVEADRGEEEGPARLRMPAAEQTERPAVSLTAEGDPGDPTPSPFRLKSFLSRFAEDSLAMFRQKENLGWIALAAGAGVFLHPTDTTTKDFFVKSDRIEEIGGIGNVIGKTAVLAAGLSASYAVAKATGDERLRGFSFTAAEAMLFQNLVTWGVKNAVGRERPDGTGHTSFYSGHTANAFTMAAVFDRFYGYRKGLPAYIVAGLIGVSRLESDKHYVSDVVVGAIVGTMIGRSFGRTGNERLEGWLLEPLVGPDGAIGIALGRRF